MVTHELVASTQGAQAGSFLATAPEVKTLAPGEKTTFKLFLKPKSPGAKNALLKIRSNDRNENPFRVTLIGQGE